MRRPAAPPKLPGIDVWVERIDAVTVAVHACRRWDGAPRLAVWQILHHPEGSGELWRWRVPGERALLATEAKVHPRWYRYVHRELARYGADGRPFNLQGIYQVEEWNRVAAMTEES